MKDITPIKTIGLDIAKEVFQIHGVNEAGEVVLRKRVRRKGLLEFMGSLPPCLVGIEACGGAHYWSRELKRLGHDVRLMHPRHVKPYIGATKNDYKDAEGICEAVGRKKMLFVPAKTVAQQDIQSLHRVRTRVIAARTALINQVRGLLGEYGVVLPQGLRVVRSRLPVVLEDGENGLTWEIRELLSGLYDELVLLDGRIKGYDKKIEQIYKTNAMCQKLGEIEGIGPISATAAVATIGDPKVFKNGRQMAAWLGLTPRQASSGDKQVLLGITKRGDSYLRYLLVHGARSVVKVSAKKEDRKSRWVNDKVIRRGKNKATVALANKTARTIWAVMAKEARYKKVA